MKLFLLPLFLLTAGLSWLGLKPGPSDVAAACERDCRVTVECIAPDTCLVTCRGASGEILCQKELTCDGEQCDRPCDDPCTKPCERPIKMQDTGSR